MNNLQHVGVGFVRGDPWRAGAAVLTKFVSSVSHVDLQTCATVVTVVTTVHSVTPSTQPKQLDGLHASTQTGGAVVAVILIRSALGMASK